MDKKPPANPSQPAQSAAPQQGTVPSLPLIPNQPIPPQMMNFVTDPALAAAAASSLFPPQAMLSNPNAFLTMPQFFPGIQAAAAMQAPPNIPKAPDGTAAGSAAMPPTQPPQMVVNQNIQTGFNSRSIQTNGTPQTPWNQPMLPTSGALLPGMVPIPQPGAKPLDPKAAATPSAMQVHLAAATAAAAAVPNNKKTGTKAGQKDSGKKKSEMTAEEKAKANRDRNREHARSTRLRKKAYVQKLKELVEGLHAERTEEVRKRRVAVQHLAEKQNVRRAVVRSFLRFHSSYEGDPRKWMTILEDNFWFKQPVTPYRSFRRVEIEQVRNLLLVRVARCS